jgi:hypothetical protein
MVGLRVEQVWQPTSQAATVLAEGERVRRVNAKGL